MCRHWLAIVAVASAAIFPSAHADLVWSWKISNPTQNVSLTDIVVVRGTLFNAPNSTITLKDFGPVVPGTQLDPISLLSFQGDFVPEKFIYDEGPIGPDTLVSQFFAASIAPGESFSFTLYSLIPIPDFVTPGVYKKEFHSLGLFGFGPGSGFLEGGPIQVTVSTVPLLPASLVFLPGILSLFAMSSVRTKVGSNKMFESDA